MILLAHAYYGDAISAFVKNRCVSSVISVEERGALPADQGPRKAFVYSYEKWQDAVLAQLGAA